MAQVEVKKKRFEKNCIDVEKIIEEMLSKKEERSIKVLEEEGEPNNSYIKKLFRKAKLNAKYLEEVIPINIVNGQVYTRNYGLY